MSSYRLTRIRRNALPDAVNNMLAGAKVGDSLVLTVYGEPSDVVITELDAEWFEGRHTPRPVTARPVGGDTREALREVGTCALCGQTMVLTDDDCWHPHDVDRACPPEPAGDSIEYVLWIKAGNRTGRPGREHFRPVTAGDR